MSITEAMSNDTEEERPEQFSTVEALITWSTICSVTAILVIIGNFLVVYCFTRHHTLRTRANSLVISLAVVDFLTGFITIPLKIFIEIEKKLGNEHMIIDDIWITSDLLFGLCSILHLTSISLERYVAICWPLHHRTATKRGYIVSIIMSWILAFGGVLIIQLPKAMEINVSVEGYLAMAIVFFLVPVIIILTCYCLINKAVKKSAKGLALHESNSRQNEVKRKQIRITVTMIIVFGAFAITWAPQFINALTTTLCEPCFHRVIYYLVKTFQYMGSALNPIIYAIRMPEFKRVLTRRGANSNKSPKTNATTATQLSPMVIRQNRNNNEDGDRANSNDKANNLSTRM